MKIIIAIHLNLDGSIHSVRLNNDEIETKQQVIQNIQSGLYYMTYNVKVSAKVEVVDNRYIRSDGNKIKKDNLDSLPTF